MIDSDGYRANVGIVITNEKKQILLAKRFKQDAWQLPQGGIDQDETELEALYRELEEEVGLVFPEQGCSSVNESVGHRRAFIGPAPNHV